MHSQLNNLISCTESIIGYGNYVSFDLIKSPFLAPLNSPWNRRAPSNFRQPLIRLSEWISYVFIIESGKGQQKLFFAQYKKDFVICLFH